MLGVTDCVADCIRLAVPQTTEWQHIGDQIDAAFIFPGVDFVDVFKSVQFTIGPVAQREV
jgi:hypothetical protein